MATKKKPVKRAKLTILMDNVAKGKVGAKTKLRAYFAAEKKKAANSCKRK